MCGIVGYVRHRPQGGGSLQPLVRALNSLGHRGPDDEGLTLITRAAGETSDWALDRTAGDLHLRAIDQTTVVEHDVAFGHRRFSIVDLSPGGHQPLWTTDRRVCVSLNGEVYNHRAIRRELEQLGWTFASSSDTEVLAVAYRQWGTDCFRKLNGFWALSLYDADRNQVLLARDRMGKAPLYCAQAHDGLYWASEVAVVRDLVPMECTVRAQSVVDFVAHSRRDYDNTTFFNEIQTLPAASWTWVGEDGSLEPQRYWELPTGRLDETDIDAEMAASELRRLLLDATELRLQADVPAAVQVSGGLDSSAVLALAAQVAPSVSAFTVKFSDSPVDEEPMARMVAERYASSVDYHIFEPPDSDLLDNVDFFVDLMGEPFHSPNQYTARGIWQAIADKGIRVNLYGSGGDEVFAGYSPIYFYPYVRSLATSGQIGRSLSELTSLTDRSPGLLGHDYLLRALRSLPSGRDRLQALRRRRLRSTDPFVDPIGLRPRPGPSEDIDRRLAELVGDGLLNYWLRIDNQNAMSIPLELRAPLLDYRIVDFAFSLPLGYLMRDGWMKWILRKAIDDDLPEAITWRQTKSGFPFPLDVWLIRHRRQLTGLLSGSDCPYIDHNTLVDHWDAHANQDPNRLWAIVSVGLWWKRVIEGDALV